MTNAEKALRAGIKKLPAENRGERFGFSVQPTTGFASSPSGAGSVTGSDASAGCAPVTAREVVAAAYASPFHSSTVSTLPSTST